MNIFCFILGISAGALTTVAFGHDPKLAFHLWFGMCLGAFSIKWFQALGIKI